MSERPRRRNVSEDARHTARVVLRLPPEVAANLRAEAARRDLTVSALVAAFVRATPAE